MNWNFHLLSLIMKNHWKIPRHFQSHELFFPLLSSTLRLKTCPPCCFHEPYQSPPGSISSQALPVVTPFCRQNGGCVYNFIGLIFRLSMLWREFTSRFDPVACLRKSKFATARCQRLCPLTSHLKAPALALPICGHRDVSIWSAEVGWLLPELFYWTWEVWSWK